MEEQCDFDPIRILIIDDNPRSLQSQVKVEGTDAVVPAIPDPDLKRYFEVLWLATVEEAREFRDAFRAISVRAPEVLGDCGIIPELLFFDYALTGNIVPVQRRAHVGAPGYRKVSPLPRLEMALKKLEMTLPPLSEPRPRIRRLETHSAEPTPGQQADNYGCFAGGLALEAFFGHPTTGVPTTRWTEDKTAESEAAIFEWMLERDAGRAFKEKGRDEPHWIPLINYAMPLLRKRIEDLHDAKMVTLSTDDLLTLSSGLYKGALRMWSRYGLRRLPVDVLFVECPKADRPSKLATWARKRLESLLHAASPDSTFEQAKNDFDKGREIAKTLWNIYSDSDLPLRRELVARLVQKQKSTALSPEEENMLSKEQVEFGLSVCADGTDVISKNVVTLITEGKGASASGRAVRWATLFLIIRLYEWKSRSLKHYQTKNIAPGFSFPRPFREITPADVFLVLYPVPDSYPKAGTSTWERNLIRLKSAERPPLPTPKGGTSKDKDDTNTGNLGLTLTDLLAGKQWRVSEETTRNEWTFGLVSGEECVLRAYAKDNGLSHSDGSPFLDAIFH